MKRAKLLVLPAVAGLLVPLLAGCGSSGGKDGSQDPIVMGSTDSIGTLDPAGAYDIGSWTLFTNTFQTLLRYPNDGSEPQPEAASKCVFTSQNSTSYRCTVRDGLKFSNGHALTASDVKFSIQRTIKIESGFGPSSLFGNLDRIETPDDKTVVFMLKQADATFPFVLATPAAAIVDEESYPANKLSTDDGIAGSGPYALSSLQRSGGRHHRLLKAEFTGNANYEGSIHAKNSKFEVRYFPDSTQMQQALEKKDIDLTHRTLTPKQITQLGGEEDRGIKVTEAPGSEIRYLVFNTKDASVQNVAVRQAMAHLIDRKALVRDVYKRTAEPLFSMIPKGIPGHINAFYNAYGEPDRDKARTALQKANVSTPVSLTLSYTSDHYGSATADEFAVIKRQLERSGLFKVQLQGKQWEDFQAGYNKRKFQVFGMGWYPDFPDPDNYIAPFVGRKNFLKSPYQNGDILNNLLPDSRRQAERSAVVDDFTKVQEILANDVPLLPLWQGRQYIAHRDNINGVQWTLDASSTFRFWELEKGSGS
ncbi:ABC transporter substrate-binding protein [Wenjunlia tyrosinilytica]|uniref:Peptide-binding protein n=1 Tax=Wenjunlia tyrosinilytica TaxID=1544741 RepID=A0A918DUJ7_9ACTN|nr:ABC transporter substrate-binding protein [Wenjunlia tyrosinilytica]GGO82860.1 peptide-binding protein [Wenjunlia tyrosinilytica]